MCADHPDRPLDDDTFASLIAPLGPFEPAPEIAVAVSGGADSLCLMFLVQRWAERRGGRAIGLTVDHGLRPESAKEAAKVGAWLGARGIFHHVLAWPGAPGGNLQARARAARYRLLGEWCRDAAIPHLATAHHREDQGETLLLRLARGSGLDGLAGMAAISERDGLRVLRPLLSVPRARLRATLREEGQPWIEDPSNDDPAFARARIRATLARVPGLSAARLADTAASLAGARAANEHAVAELLARAVAIHPAGFAWIDAALLCRAPEDLGLRALSRVVTCVGGGAYPPRFVRLRRLYRAFTEDGLQNGRTLAGCRLVTRRGRILVCREAAAADHVLALKPGHKGHWDGRFRVRLGAQTRGDADLAVRRLGADGWRQVKDTPGADRLADLPAPARHGLPALWGLDDVVALPHLPYWRGAMESGAPPWFSATFAPLRPLAGPAFRGI